jgi:hypothetical protein
MAWSLTSTGVGGVVEEDGNHQNFHIVPHGTHVIAGKNENIASLLRLLISFHACTLHTANELRTPCHVSAENTTLRLNPLLTFWATCSHQP